MHLAFGPEHVPERWKALEEEATIYKPLAICPITKLGSAKSGA